MHTSADPSRSSTDRTHRWRYPPVLLRLNWATTCFLVVTTLLAPDGMDRVLSGTGALLIGVVSGGLSYLQPRLRADPTGITVRTLRGPRTWSWEQVSVRGRIVPRLGLRVSVLELDVPETDVSGGLIVIGRMELYADPFEVAETLNGLKSG
ncbi:PH domain-containing protein [Actinopolyspora mortivallis]|uniref:PH domain-containing protein n=1 Tax=Actinopolyspora mortivallis TaxID=33906 RepID=UPI000363AB99|nr:PH domain-containing protein [Actinopolyspora mortivallis]